MTNDNRQLIENTDAFGNLTHPRTNVLDIAAHYPYSPVRWRLFVDGSRVFPEYNSVSQYNHATDVHELKPNAGETVVFETTERPRYVVAYELAATFAFDYNQELQGDDKIRVGLWDGDNGWYLEQNSSHAVDRADFIELRDNTETYRKENVDTLTSLQEFHRLKLETGWYQVTRQTWERSYSSNGRQVNGEIGSFDSGSSRNGPKYGNLPLRYEVTADSNSTDLTLNAGSTAQVNLGDTVPLTRDKKLFGEGTIDTADVYQPLAAYRVDPDRFIINTEVEDFTCRKTTTSSDTYLLFQSFAKENVRDGNGNQLQDSDFSSPNSQSTQTSVLEVATNVEQVVDSDGNLQTGMANPGGYQVQSAALYTGTGQTKTTAVGPGAIVKRTVTDRDYVVVLAKSGATGDVFWDLQTEQDW